MIDAFRLINPNMMVLGQEPRQTTSNLGHLQKPSIQVGSVILLAVCQPFLFHFKTFSIALQWFIRLLIIK